MFLRGPCTKKGSNHARGRIFGRAVHEKGVKTCTGVCFYGGHAQKRGQIMHGVAKVANDISKSPPKGRGFGWG